MVECSVAKLNANVKEVGENDKGVKVKNGSNGVKIAKTEVEPKA